MANVIIEIHGLGNKPPKYLLERWWKLAMIEGLKDNSYKSQLPEYEMVYWADILYDQPLNQFETDEENPYYLDEVYCKRSHRFTRENQDTRKKIVNFINRQLNKFLLRDDLSLNYSFVTDAILNNYFQDLASYYKEENGSDEQANNKIKDLIRERLFSVLEKYKGYEIMLIAHSMGSIVAFDVLSFMATHIPVQVFVTIGSPLGLPIVVSKIAKEQKFKTNGQSKIITPPNVLKKWYNFSDILDKVALNYELGDDFIENEHGVKPFDFLVENNYVINEIPNPHKSYGYLRTPEFAKVLNEFILSEKLSLVQKLRREINKIQDELKVRFVVQRRKVRTWFHKIKE